MSIGTASSIPTPRPLDGIDKIKSNIISATDSIQSTTRRIEDFVHNLFVQPPDSPPDKITGAVEVSPQSLPVSTLLNRLEMACRELDGVVSRIAQGEV